MEKQKELLPVLPALLIFPAGLLLFHNPTAKLFWATAGLLFLLKIGSLTRNHRQKMALPKGAGWLLYLFLWPGMRPESFGERIAQKQAVGREFVSGFLFLFLA